ncbi:MAG: hypothetical protein AAF687_04070 [Pseudomonadota bacterium]
MINDQPILRDTPLGQLLDKDVVPELSKGFADRVLVGTKDRAPPLPEPGRKPVVVKRWRSVRRLGIGVVAFGAVASAAAATGLLDDLPIEIPSAKQVWSALTGEEAEPAPAPKVIIPTKEAEPTSGADEGPSRNPFFDGPISSPQQLEEAFKRVDDVRAGRKATREEFMDNRIDRMIERRRANGRPVPTPEQERRLRERIDQFRESREALTDEMIEKRRAALRERVENGDELTREEFIRGQRGDRSDPDRVRGPFEDLRNMTPRERRQILRQLRDEALQEQSPDADQGEEDSGDSAAADNGSNEQKPD